MARGEDAYEQLKSSIEAGELLPGTRLREAELAGQLGVSRTPVREAIRRLEAEGLVSMMPRSGAVVAALDHQSMMELYDFRCVLEGMAARLVARHASDVEIDEIRELIASEVPLADDPSRLAELNRQLHSLLYRAARNRYLERTLLSLRSAMTLLGGTTMRIEGRSMTAHAEHQAILAAIEARDPDAAEAAARQHLLNAQRARLKLTRAALLDNPDG